MQRLRHLLAVTFAALFSTGIAASETDQLPCSVDYTPPDIGPLADDFGGPSLDENHLFGAASAPGEISHDPTTPFTTEQSIDVTWFLQPREEHVGEEVSIFIFARHNLTYYTQDEAGNWFPWYGEPSNAHPRATAYTLRPRQLIRAVEGLRGLPGEFVVMLAYQLPNGYVCTEHPGTSFTVTP